MLLDHGLGIDGFTMRHFVHVLQIEIQLFGANVDRPVTMDTHVTNGN